MTGQPPQKSLISLRNISRDISVSKERVQRLLSNVTWELRQGQRVGILSSSMPEAHAFLSCAAGVTTPQYGEVCIRAHVSWPLGSKGGLLNELTGRENANFLQKIYGNGSKLKDELEQLQFLADLDPGFFDKPLKTYNKYMRSRFNMAISLIFEFDAYIIPKHNAWKPNPDSERLTRLQKALQQKTKDKPILMTNNNFDFIAQYCDEGVVLHKGSIAHTGSFSECREWYETNINKAPEDDNSEGLKEESMDDSFQFDELNSEDDLW